MKKYITDITHISFAGDKVPTFTHEGVAYVALKPVVVQMGMDWGKQRQKVTANPELFEASKIEVHVPQKRVSGPVVAITLQGFAFFLANIQASRVPEEHRGKLVRYQKECAIVLHDYWMHGLAINPRQVPHQFDSKFTDARSYSRPRLVKTVKKYVEHAHRVGVAISEDDIYNGLLSICYEYLGVTPRHDMEKLSGRDATFLAFMENICSDVMLHIIQWDKNPAELLEYVATHMSGHLVKVGNMFMELADSTPMSMYREV